MINDDDDDDDHIKRGLFCNAKTTLIPIIIIDTLTVAC